MSKATHPRAHPCVDDESREAYITKQRARDADYARKYQEWVKSLTPEERRQLADLGLDKPQMAHTSAGGYCNAAELAACAVSPEDVDGHDEATKSKNYPQFADSEAAHDLLRLLIGELLSQDNARLSVECLALVTGLAYDGDSMTDIAKRHSLTRAAVSKRCVEFTHALRLDPCRAMRSLKARESYRQSRNHQLREQP